MRHFLPSVLFLAASAPAFATIDSGLLALVPSGATVISGVDVNRAKSSQFGQYVLGKVNTDNQDFHDMIQETGFDPRRDIQDVLFVGTGLATDGNATRCGILVRGNFDQDRIKKTLTDKGAKAQLYQGTQMLVDTSSHGQKAFAFPDVDIAVMGDVATVQQIIGNRSNPTTLDPSLQQLVSAAGASHDAWFASSVSGSFLANNLRQDGSQPFNPAALQAILESSGGISFADVVQISFDAVTRSAKDATALADVVRFGASMAQVQGQKDARANILASTLDTMTLTTDGSTLHLSVSIPENGLEQLAEMGQHSPGSAVKPTRQSAR